MIDAQTPFDICTTARKARKWGDEPKVIVSMRSGPVVVGKLVGVSPVNAWIKVGGQKVPCDYIKRVEYV